MQEKIRLIIIMGLVVMLAVSLFIGQQTYSAKKAIELERNGLRNENENLAGKLAEITKERKQLQEKVDALSNDLAKLLEEKDDIQKQYESLVKERDAMAGKLKALQGNNEQLRADLGNLSLEKKRLGQNLEDNLALLKNENAQLKEQLKQELDNLNSLKSNLEAELWQLKGDKSYLERKFNEIDSFLEQSLTGAKYASLKEQIYAIRSGGQTGAEAETETPQPEKESVELPPIVVRPQIQAQVRTPARPKKRTAIKQTGAILEINKANNFVIVDLGQDAGIKMGDIFNVYRQGVPIATIEVVHVRQSLFAGDIKEEITAIEAGDSVK